jgi:hypothetical protein
MANDDYREPQQAAREHGLKARQAVRQERAIRRRVAEEIALAIEELRDKGARTPMPRGFLTDAARIAREIGSKDAPQPLPDALHARTEALTDTEPSQGSQAVRSPQEPCEDPGCPIVLMHSHPDPLGEHSSNPREDG